MTSDRPPHRYRVSAFCRARALPLFRNAAIDFDTLETALLQFGKVALIFAFATAHDGRQQIKPFRLPRHSRSTIWLTVWLSMGRPVAGE